MAVSSNSTITSRRAVDDAEVERVQGIMRQMLPEIGSEIYTRFMAEGRHAEAAEILDMMRTLGAAMPGSALQ
jgi:hypothetical protein